MNDPISRESQIAHPAEPESDLRIDPVGARWQLVCPQWVPQPLDEVFPFFANAYNLEALTPPFLKFRVRRVTGAPIRVGTLIDYRLTLHGAPVWWRTRIAEWTPPTGFVDEQIRGPFRHWHHHHQFRATRGGTELRDVVTFDLYCRSLHRTPLLSWVLRDVRGIFEYRRGRIQRQFGRSDGA